MRTDQTVECWGNNDDGQAEAPGGEFVSIAAGDFHTCGVLASQSILCWGSNDVGQTKAPGGSFVAIEAGDNHSCAIGVDGAVACWGHNGDGQTNSPSGGFETVTAGREHSCGTRTDGSVVCWGANDHGESEAPEGFYVAVSAGEGFSCGLQANGTVSCWGRALVVGAPVAVDHFTPPFWPDAQVCRPHGASGITVGFPLPNWAVPSVGSVRVAVLFVDFPDAEATHSTQQEGAFGLPYTKQYLETVSYRQFEPHFEPLHRWLRAEHNYAHYLEKSVLGTATLDSQVTEEAVRLADPEFDFTDIDAVMVVMPSFHFGGGIGGQEVTTDEGTIWNTTHVNNFPIDETREPSQWGATAAHELMHNLGLSDLYPYDAKRHKPPYPPAGVWVETQFGLMGLDGYFHAAEDDPRLSYRILFPNGQRQTGYTQRLEAAEMLAWSRWQLGWLKPEQIHCITQLETETTISISPVAFPGNEPAMVAIPISDTEVIVIESRRKLGYDAGREHRWSDGVETTFPALPDEGVLVYTVDASLESGQLPIKVAGDPGNGHLEREPILTEGESITVGNYTITVTISAYNWDTVTITKTPSP